MILNISTVYIKFHNKIGINVESLNFVKIYIKMLDELRDIAIRFQIDPVSTVGHAAKLDSVIKVLSKLNESFNNFLEIEFLKNEDFNKIYQENPSVLKAIKDELDLLIVDLKFSSFEAALAPNISNNQISLYKNDVLEWKKDTFLEYKENIILADYNNINYIETINLRYDEEEKNRIFNPLFHSFGVNNLYGVNLKDNAGKVIKSFIQPDKSKLPFFISKTKKSQQVLETGTFQVFVKAKKIDGKLDFKKSDISKFLYFEELEHETYPYKPNLIKFDGHIYSLSENLSCEIDFQDGIYIIKNDYLDIIAWGQSREEVEEAFNFSFHSSYINYALENDEALSDEAKELKHKMNKLVKATFNENKKN